MTELSPQSTLETNSSPERTENELRELGVACLATTIDTSALAENNGDTIDEPQSTEATLSDKQLNLLVKYVQGGLDNDIGTAHYMSVLKTSEKYSTDEDREPTAGRIALTAATMASLARDPRMFDAQSGGLMKKLHELGVQKEHLMVFNKMQRRVIDMSERNPLVVAEQLQSGLKYLDNRRDNYGEDISLSKLMYLSGSFASTKEPRLRKLIYNQLKPVA